MTRTRTRILRTLAVGAIALGSAAAISGQAGAVSGDTNDDGFVIPEVQPPPVDDPIVCVDWLDGGWCGPLSEIPEEPPCGDTPECYPPEEPPEEPPEAPVPTPVPRTPNFTG